MKRFTNHSMTIFCLALFIGAGAIFPLVNSASTSASEDVDCGVAGSSLRLAQQHMAPGQARSLAAGDFNQDGRPDLAIATTGADPLNNISIFLGDGSGYLEHVVTVPVTGSLSEVAAGDFNRDGKQDLAVSGQTTDSETGVAILLGAGDGSFRGANTYAAGSGAGAMAIADFNGDGNQDIAMANRFASNIAVLLGNGAGAFAQAVKYTVGASPVSIVSADFDGDGKPDLAVANQNVSFISLLINKGAGEFNTAVNVDARFSCSSIATGDFNGDARPDLVVGQLTNIAVLIGDGRGGFGAPRSFGNRTAASIVVRDFNGDGSFNGPMNVNIGRLPFAVAIGDFNSDGKPDFAASVYISQESAEDRVLIFAGDGRGRFSGAGEFVAPSARYLAAGDVNADGLFDLAVSAGGNSSIWLAPSECNATRPVALTSVSAASYRRLNLASESIVAAFGTGLSAETAAATTLPLPTELAGTTVKVKDGAGVERAAPLFFVSPSQVNYQMPAGTAVGAATVTITRGGASSSGTTQITAVAPGLFTANASGQGAPAGVALRVKPNGAQLYEPIAQFDAAQNQFVPVAIDLGIQPPNFNDQVFLILFGTGLRGRSSLSTVRAQVGGSDVEALYVGSQGALVGLDQVNLRLPRSLIPRGEVDVALTVDGKTSNAVKVKIL